MSTRFRWSFRRRGRRRPTELADALDPVAELRELRGDGVAVVALDLDRTVFDRAAAAAARFELFRERLQGGGSQLEATGDGDALAAARFAIELDADGLRRRRVSRTSGIFCDSRRRFASSGSLV